MTLTNGQMLQGRYRVVKLLGQGGMGAVYKAWDMRLKMNVALKEMVPQPGLDPRTLTQLRQQFEQEAIIMARLKHNHLVGVTDFFEELGNAYLVMEFVEGESLEEFIEREGSLPEEQVLLWADQLLDALEYCHSQGIIHRDISPQNVIIRPDGRAVLVDFGLVKLWDPRDPRTQTAMRGMGKPEYAPPEQYDTHSGHTDARSDIYGLGATLYHALTGEAPPTATQRMVNPNLLKLPKTLNSRLSTDTERAILKAMEPQPPQRFQSAREMMQALSGDAPESIQRDAQPEQVRTRVMPGSSFALPWWRRMPVWSWGMGGIIALALVIGLVITLTSDRGAVKIAVTTTSSTSVKATATPRSSAASASTSQVVDSLKIHPLFVSDRDGKREIYHIVKGETVERITTTPGNSESWLPVLATDGTVLFTSDREGKREIYHITKEGSVERVTNTPGNAESWSPVVAADSTVLFTSDRDGKREIYHITKEGSVERVTSTPGDAESWSPVLAADGTTLFTSNRDGKREIYHVTKEGSVERVTSTPGDAESWSPVLAKDGSVLFTSDRDGKREVYQITREGEVVRVTRTPGSGESWLSIR